MTCIQLQILKMEIFLCIGEISKTKKQALLNLLKRDK